MRRVAVVITARPSYSRFRTALEAIDAHANLELILMISGSAMLPRYGSPLAYMGEDGLNPDVGMFNVIEGDARSSPAKTTGLAMIDLATELDRASPDVVVSVADRYETLATAAAAAFSHTPLLHIQGGEVSGSIDEKVRHAVTKLADIHCVATEQARDYLVRMGEAPSSVHLTGGPDLDIAARVMNARHRRLDFDPFSTYGGVGPALDLSDGYVVALQHPVTTSAEAAADQVGATLDALEAVGLPVLWFWPNVDTGSDAIAKTIRRFREDGRGEHMHFFLGMDSEDFLTLLLHSRCVVGNSSVAIRECSLLGVPAVNIGERQDGRLHSHNVTHAAYDVEDIIESVREASSRGRLEPDFIYGDGSAGERVAEVLASARLTTTKKLHYTVESSDA